jgi:hypothetical protein
LLFANPGNRRHWLKLKLVGTKTNRAALGARVQVDLALPNGSIRSIHRQVGGGSSYGGNSLVQHIGLGDAAADAMVTITWPASRSQQVFRGIASDQFVEITEGNDAHRVLNGQRALNQERNPLP